jgi:hypothetical protein
VGTLGGFLLTDLGGFPGLSVDPALHVFYAPKCRPPNFERRGQAMCRVWVLQQIIKITAGYAQPIRQILRAVSQRVRVFLGHYAPPSGTHRLSNQASTSFLRQRRLPLVSFIGEGKSPAFRQRHNVAELTSRRRRTSILRSNVSQTPIKISFDGVVLIYIAGVFLSVCALVKVFQVANKCNVYLRQNVI